MGSIFEGIYNNGIVSAISVPVFLACIAVSLLIGVFLAVVSIYENHYTKSFVITLALLPAIVCVVILMVNGNVGAGVAVAGTFSLVRFRSVPGTAKEIGLIFLAMSAGLVAGMGYLGYAVLFALIMGLLMMFYHKINLGGKNFAERDKILRITIPEDLDYSGIFDDLFEKYTEKKEVVSVKTTNMGSMFKLTYHITLKNIAQEKEFMDELRCRNGNLEIALSRQEESGNEL
jgi:flagellar biosynthesis protein FliQ